MTEKKKPRRHVVIIEFTTEDVKTSRGLRAAALRWAGQMPAPTGVKVSTHTVDWPATTQPVVIMERTLP